MLLGKRLIVSVLSLIIFAPTISGITQAKSVYVITDRSSTVKAYRIVNDQIEEQTTAQDLPDNGSGAVGLALDPDSETLFVTYEGSNIIEMLNAKTMVSLQNPVTVLGVGFYGLSGIAFDQNKQKLYVVERQDNRLYVYLWDPVDKTLTLEGGTYKTLENIGTYPYGAYGIALDESAERLYVSNATSTVHYYDTNDPNWPHKGSIDIVVDYNERDAVGIDIDSTNHYMYTGMFHGTGGSHDFLVKTDISDINNPLFAEKDIGARVIGIAADEDTGLVYITTYDSHHIEVHNRATWESDPCDTETQGISGPADIVLAGDVGYKPSFPLLTLVKDNNDPNDDCVSPLISEFEHEWMETPYNWLYYEIEYDANGHSDTNVKITDYLPKEVNEPNFISDGGVYDSNMHTVTWNNIGDISASDSNTFWIQVAVNYYAKPGHKIINYCEIESDEYFMFTTEDVNVCCYGGNIIYVDEDANDPNSYNNGTSWFDAYRDLQDAFHTARNCGAEQIRVAEGTYKPTYINDTGARSISFELLDDVAVYGGFPTGGGTWFERNPATYETILSGEIGTPNDLSDNSYHVVKCQDVNNAILDGFTITAGNADAYSPDEPNQRGGGIYSNGSNNLTVRHCTIIENEAYCKGGGIYNVQSSPTLINCTFSGNSATATVVYTYGGAIYNYYDSDPNVTNCTFSNNSAREGGAVYNYYYSDPNIINCIFTGNTAYNYGGGMVNSNESSPTITNCTFSGNSTTATGVSTYGGAICNWIYSDPNVTNCTFSNNSASHGGGLFNESSDPNVTNCIFTNNTAVYYGGGIYNRNDSSPTVANCVFSGNSSDYYGGGMANVQSSSSVRNCIFSGNSAGWGGGMQNYNESSPTVTNCSFSGNSAGWGGGMQDYNESSPTVTNCTFSGNWAYYGGGMHNENNSDPNITNCIFWRNYADWEGNEIFNWGDPDPNISYCDIEDSNGSGNDWHKKLGTDKGGNIDEDPCFMGVNTPTGSWTANASYDSSTYQSTLTNANASWSVNEFVAKFVDPNTSQYLQFFIVSNDTNTITVWSDVTSIAHINDTYEIFDYHLSSDSNCIDKGDPNFNPDPNETDIDGEPRIVNGRVDIGADEYYWSPADFNEDETVNFIDYAMFANFWQTEKPDFSLDDDNDVDMNDLALFVDDWLWEAGWAQTQGLMMGRSMGQGFGLMEALYQPAPAKKPQARIEPLDIEYILKWLEELWLTSEELRKMISEDEWLKFIKSVGDSY